MHLSFGDQRLSAVDVYIAPNTARPARRETNRVAGLVNFLADAVYPAEAERLIHRLGPGNAWFAGVFLVKAHQQFILCGVMLHKPRAEFGGCAKEGWLHELEEPERDAYVWFDFAQKTVVIDLRIVNVIANCMTDHLGCGERDEQFFQVISSHIFVKP